MGQSLSETGQSPCSPLRAPSRDRVWRRDSCCCYCCQALQRPPTLSLCVAPNRKKKKRSHVRGILPAYIAVISRSKTSLPLSVLALSLLITGRRPNPHPFPLGRGPYSNHQNPIYRHCIFATCICVYANARSLPIVRQPPRLPSLQPEWVPRFLPLLTIPEAVHEETPNQMRRYVRPPAGASTGFADS